MSRAKQDSARKIQFPVLFRRRQRTKTASSKGLAEKVRISKCEHHEEKVRLHEEKVSNSPDLRRLTHERGTRIRFFVLLMRCRHLTSDCRTQGARKKNTLKAIDFLVILGHDRHEGDCWMQRARGKNVRRTKASDDCRMNCIDCSTKESRIPERVPGVERQKNPIFVNSSGNR